jgi:hypothetical protein
MKIIKSFEDKCHAIRIAGDPKSKWSWGLGEDGALYGKYNNGAFMKQTYYSGTHQPDLKSILKIAKEFGPLMAFL